VAPDLTPAIRAYFLDHRFAEVDFAADAELFPESIGVNRYEGELQPLQPDVRFFTFLAERRCDRADV
jgi:hypothetical protein